MREIKFRAWEKSLNEMIPVDRIDFDKQMINTNGPWRFLNEVELMQYTGLKDKNGVEIYEGDIVHKTYNSNNLTATGEVIYDSATYFIREVEGYAFLHGGHEGEKLEVIGNIYENSELLEESK